MPFKSDKQRKWMHANEPEMAKKWEKEEESVNEATNIKDLQMQVMVSLEDKGIKSKALRKLKKVGRDYSLFMASYMSQNSMTNLIKNVNKSLGSKFKIKKASKGPAGVQYIIGEAKKRDYKDEYKKFQSSTKSKKYRAELNKYNRKKGTYGNGDGKDASHKGGKISGFEKESVNRGRKEKSRLKKEQKLREVIRNILIDEGFGGELPKTEKKEFEKVRKEQSEVLGYKLTGKEDVKESRADVISNMFKTKWKTSKGHGRGQSWMNYDKGKLRLQITKSGSKYSASMFVLPMKHSSGSIFRIVGISKQDADKIKSTLMTKGTDMHVVQGIRNKYKKYLKEGVAGGLTYKKGKTITVTHKTSGKELVIIDKPAVRREYEKIGYVAEGNFTEAKENAIDVARRVVQNKQHEKGLDLTTANFIMQVYNAYKKNPALQKKLEKLPLKKMIGIVYKLIK